MPRGGGPQVHISRRGSIDINGVRLEDLIAAKADESACGSPTEAAPPSSPAAREASSQRNKSAGAKRYTAAVELVDEKIESCKAPSIAFAMAGSPEASARLLADRLKSALESIESRTLQDESFIHAIRTTFILIRAGCVLRAHAHFLRSRSMVVVHVPMPRVLTPPPSPPRSSSSSSVVAERSAWPHSA